MLAEGITNILPMTGWLGRGDGGVTPLYFRDQYFVIVIDTEDLNKNKFPSMLDSYWTEMYPIYPSPSYVRYMVVPILNYIIDQGFKKNTETPS